MSTPPEPGRSPYPDGAGQPGPRPSGPPPRPSGPGPAPGPQPSGPGRPGPDQPPHTWIPQPRPAEEPPPYAPKGFFGALFDTRFDHMITTRLIRLVYVLVIGLTGITALTMLIFAWSFSEWSGTLALVTLLATPVVSLFQIVTTRLVLEFFINQFKITEELQKIREGRPRA